MKTKPTGARRAQTKSAQSEAPRIWNTLGVASLLATTPARVMRALANGEIKSTVRIVGGGQREGFAFTLHDVQGYAEKLMEREWGNPIGSAALRFLGETKPKAE